MSGSGTTTQSARKTEEAIGLESLDLKPDICKRIVTCGSESLKYIASHFHPEYKDVGYHQHFSEQGENLLFLYASVLHIMQQCVQLATLMRTNECSADKNGGESLADLLCETYDHALRDLQSMLSLWSSELYNEYLHAVVGVAPAQLALTASSLSTSVTASSAFASAAAAAAGVIAETSHLETPTTKMSELSEPVRRVHFPTSTVWFVRHWFPDLDHFTPHGMFAAAHKKDQARRLDAHEDTYSKETLETCAAANDWNGVIDVAMEEWISTTDLSNRKVVIEDCLHLLQLYLPKIRVVYCRETGSVDNVMWILFLTHVVFMITQYGVQWKIDLDQFDVCAGDGLDVEEQSSCSQNTHGDHKHDVMVLDNKMFNASSDEIMKTLRTYLFGECFWSTCRQLKFS